MDPVTKTYEGYTFQVERKRKSRRGQKTAPIGYSVSATADVTDGEDEYPNTDVKVHDGGFVYLSFAPPHFRVYWIIDKIPAEERPAVTFKDDRQIITIDTYRIVYRTPVEYYAAKYILCEKSATIRP